MSEFTGASVDAVDIIAQTLTIGSKEITGITDDSTQGSPNNLVTALAVQSAVASLVSMIQTNVQNVLTGVDGQVVLSQNLVNPNYELVAQDPILGWTTIGWVSQNNTASITNPSGTFSTANKLSIPPARYPSIGIYLLTIEASSVSGTLSVVFNNSTIGTISAPGSYNFLLNVANALTTTLDLVAADIMAGQSIVLTTASLTEINLVLYNLLEYITNQFILTSQDAAINAAVFGGIAAANITTLNEITAAIAAHIAATNPHTQYVLKTNLSDSTILPGIIVSSPDAYVPVQIPGSDVLRSSTILKTKNLNHISNSAYCAQSGYLTSNSPVEVSSQLVNALTNSETASVQPTTLFVLNPSKLPTLTYKFFKPRPISQVTLFTQNNTGVASVTGAIVSCSTGTGNVSLPVASAGTISSNSIDLSFVTINGPVVSDQLSITITSVSDTTQASLAIGFNIDFLDTGIQDIAISGDTIVSMNYNGQIVKLSPVTDVPVTVSSAVVDHQYAISLKTIDGVTVTPELITPLPHIGDGSINYKYILQNTTSDISNYFGTTSIQGVTISSGFYQIYTTPNAIVTNSNVVTITQTFTEFTQIDHFNILFPGTLPSGSSYPDSISINITQSSGTVVDVVYPQSYQIDGISTNYSTKIDLSSYGPLSNIEIILTSAVGSNCALELLEIAIPCISYDTTQNVWSDGVARKIVGAFTKLSNGIYQTISQPVGEIAYIAVNDLQPCQFYIQYKVQNPFNSKNISIKPVTSDGLDSNSLTVVSYNESVINLLCTAAGTYLLQISRNW